MARTFSRRRVLALGAAAGLAPVLGACGDGGSSSSNGSTGPVELPTYKPVTSATPDLAAEPAGVSPGYFSYPTASSAASQPVRGKAVTALTYTYDPIAPALGSNPYWQNLNDRLGTELKITYVASADYKSRVATTIAGGDLPDMVAIQGVVQQMPAMLNATFTDLTEHLSGDAVLAYPNLAGLPTDAWRSTVYDQRIWGIPVPRARIGTVLYTRADLLAKAGLSLQPRSWDEFKQMAAALTDERAGRWAFGQIPFNTILEMNGITGNWPGGVGAWQAKDGVFTHSGTTPQFAQALADAVELVKSGVVHPDQAGAPNTKRNQWMLAGTTAFTIGLYAGWGKFYGQAKDVPGFRLTGMLSPTRDGTGTQVRTPGPTLSSFTAIAKTDDVDRVKQILKVLDWLCAPFGSSEYTALRYGVEGQTFNRNGSDPTLTEGGRSQTLLPVRYLAEASPVVYEPGNRQAVQDQYDHQVAGVPLAVPDPTLGLYSETAASKAASEQQELDAVLLEIQLGNKPVSAWQPAIKQFMDRVGDKIKAEYEEQAGR
ncbi:extracellular solute-binding protein [Micromonospora sp. WMMD1102]|uniref:extracellular solute-binding protein n=1 Tax=Micromonospora sp. WMMD1102 TaxID=3016105 RepID=UPI002414E36D|nr:extracellular solute-binding protein [Micromonospora sp. WMMD1102]MDG4788664.1 extracellular solute-binding protein [Micromonospora sp. WMMD1102]